MASFRRFSRAAWLLFVAMLSCWCEGCFFPRIIYYNTPDLSAPHYFDSREVKASSTPAPFSTSTPEASFALSAHERSRYSSFDELLEREQTRAFIALHDDAIVYERYFHDVDSNTELPGFSVTKTYAAALLGRALEEGVFSSISAPITAFVPELASAPRYSEITLDQLLRMTSGIDFDEESLSGARLYYTTDLRDLMYSYEVKWAPGTHYLYGSVNIQLLWDALQRKLDRETVSHYFERELWQPLGATHAASWSLDSAESGAEKFFGGFNATARDHARIGLLYLHGGNWNGREILPASWVARSLTPDPVAGFVHTTDGWVRRGMYQWFLTRDGRAYFAKGYHGQYIFVVPDKHWVFVRFGVGYGEIDWPALFLRLADSAP